MATEFTKEDSFKFLRNVLKIPQPELDWIQRNKLDFLTNIITNWYEFVPFQNIDQLCLTKHEKRLPTLEEIITTMMTGKGGLCLHLAVFCHLLLSSLNFNVHLAIASIRSRHDHAIVIASDVVDKGDSFLIDAGCGFPTLTPICLSSVGDSFTTAQIYLDGFLEYAYIKENDSIVRYHRRGDDGRFDDDVLREGWRKFYDTDLKPVSVDYLYSSDAKIYTTVIDPKSNSNLARVVRAVRYPKNGGVIIRKKELITYKNEDKIIKPLSDINEILFHYNAYFPAIDIKSIQEAYEFADEQFKLQQHEKQA